MYWQYIIKYYLFRYWFLLIELNILNSFSFCSSRRWYIINKWRLKWYTLIIIFWCWIRYMNCRSLRRWWSLRLNCIYMFLIIMDLSNITLNKLNSIGQIISHLLSIFWWWRIFNMRKTYASFFLFSLNFDFRNFHFTNKI